MVQQQSTIASNGNAATQSASSEQHSTANTTTNPQQSLPLITNNNTPLLSAIPSGAGGSITTGVAASAMQHQDQTQQPTVAVSSPSSAPSTESMALPLVTTQPITNNSIVQTPTKSENQSKGIIIYSIETQNYLKHKFIINNIKLLFVVILLLIWKTNCSKFACNTTILFLEITIINWHYFKKSNQKNKIKTKRYRNQKKPNFKFKNQSFVCMCIWKIS